MTTVSEHEAAGLARKIAALEEQLRSAVAERDAAVERQTAATLEQFRLQTELRAALDRQKASAEILRSIAATSGDAAHALRQIAETTAHFFNAPSVTIRIAEGDRWVQDIRVGSGSLASGAHPGSPLIERGTSLPATVYQDNRQIHIPDLDSIDPSMAHWPAVATRAVGIRTISGTPLRREGHAIGAMIIYRDRLAPFTDEELALQQSFADQAVIAIENARLFNETKEALERQTATADILKVIASSPSDAQPVFDAIAARANGLVGGFSTAVHRFADDMVELAAYTPTNPESDAALKATFPMRRSELMPLALVENGETVQIADIEAGDAVSRRLGRARGWRSVTLTPLMNRGACIGFIACSRRETGVLADHHVQLLRTFADQAVIAIENTRLFNETQEALARQTATSDILRVISGSPTDVQPVFDAIVRTAVRLLGCDRAFFMRVDGHTYTPVAGMNRDGPAPLGAPDQPIDPAANFPSRAIATRQMLHLPDWARIELPEHERAVRERFGVKSALYLPLLRGDDCIGLLALVGSQPNMFGETEIAFAESFRDQALIAIENTRLFNETQEALERQTATADILKVIASSPSDVTPVFEAIAIRAKSLVGGFSSTVFRFIDGIAHLQAFTPTSPEADEVLKSTFPRPVDDFAPFRMTQAGEIMQIPDTEALTDDILGISRARGFRSMVFAPLVNKGTSIGFIAVTRVQPGSFSDHHVQVLRTFGNQAVIAIENARLFDEVQAKTRDLEESLRQQTATADVLKVIGRSAFDLNQVFETVVESSVRLCAADRAIIFRFDGELLRAALVHNAPEELKTWLDQNPIRPGRHSVAARAALERRTVQVEDVRADAQHTYGAKEIEPFRTVLGVPMLKGDDLLGVILVYHNVVKPFTDKQILLVSTFAEQAAIAIDNTRLFDEVQAKTRDLEESLQQQTATSEVLQVISSSPGELGPVFDKMLENATRICGAEFGSMSLVEGDTLRQAALYNAPVALAAARANKVAPLHPQSSLATAIRTRQVIQVADLRTSPTYGERWPSTVELVELGGARTIVVVPMLRESEVIGLIVVYRQEVRAFGDKQMDLLTNFARQAVIAIENARLLGELRQRTADLSKSLDDLRTAQGRLIQTEKLASLGQLTAGIAHEIKNPLNFVNNFSALSIELTSELNDLLKQATLAEELRDEVDELTTLLKDNLAKVVQHGKRADSIVKNMLLHSREGSGEHRPADVNALVDESLNLAYHGARAEKPQFNVTLQRDFDPEAGMIEAFPQEITRVLLNLISNGFYAVTKRKAQNDSDGFEPTVVASTRGLADHVEIRIRDNGTGIPPEVKEKMFNPFFTTKPAGEGTGLGLSMSHDIVVKQHGGTIEVETEQGAFTEFRVVLPRSSAAGKGAGG
jgi:two-component system, NtrC family, sensor kinase